MPDGFEREALWTEWISVLACSGHPSLSAERVSLDEPRCNDLVFQHPVGRPGGQHLLSLLGIGSATTLRFSFYGFIRGMLHGTDLLSVISRLMMVSDLLRGMLRVVPLPMPALDPPARLVLPRGHALPLAGLAFAECLHAYVAEITERGIGACIINGDNKVRRSDRKGRARRIERDRPRAAFSLRDATSRQQSPHGPANGRRREDLPRATPTHVRPTRPAPASAR